MRFFHKSYEVYTALAVGVLGNFREGDFRIEEGILSELDGKRSPGKFRSALTSYQRASSQMTVLDQKLGELINLYAAGKPVPAFEQALANILKESKPFERVTARGVRYSNVAGVQSPEDMPALQSLDGILRAQRTDLVVLKAKLDEAIDALRAAIPLAEKGEFVPVMLSGRPGFGEKMPLATDLISVYERFYTKSCMATIAATMQAYPAGFEWLNRPPQRVGAR